MPRAKRTSKATEPTMPPEAPKCSRCGRELDWHDCAYVPAPKPADQAEGKAADAAAAATPSLCKRCHQRGQRKRRDGFVAFHPAPVVNRTSRRSFSHFAEERIAAYGERVMRQKQAKRTLAARRTARTRAVA